jgi:outer membrane immunogenic protein
MRKFTAMAAAAAFVGSASFASAADLGGSYKDESIASYGPSYSWAGLYIGGSAGFGTGDTETTIEGFSIADYEVNGAIFGAHVGYNFQRGNVVFGVEAGINGTDMDGSQQILGPLLTSERELDWYATAVARLGYASGKTLFYGFGGVAWADVTTKVGSILLSDTIDSEDTHVGWTAGLGIEHALSDRFSVRLEYSHVDLGEGDGLLTEVGLDHEVDLKFDAIKIGASYKFGGESHAEALK